MIDPKNTIADWAWAAGYFDGEGSISIHVAYPRNRPNPRYHIGVSITQCMVEPQLWMVDHFGGSINTLNKRNMRYRQQWRWDIKQAQAAEFIKGLRPYLKVKHRQADLLAEFYSRITKSTKSLPQSEHDARILIAMQMQELNKGIFTDVECLI